MTAPLSLQQLSEIVDQELKDLPAFNYDKRQIYDNAVREACERITYRTGANIQHDWRGARVKMGGVRTTSTSSTVQALNNWQVAASKRIAREAEVDRIIKETTAAIKEAS